MTPTEFFEAYKKGERYFSNLDFEYSEGFSNNDFSDIIFHKCFLYLDFRNTNFTNAQFIECNIKEIDLRNTNLTNAKMKNCLVESAMFKDALVEGFEFIDNYYFGITVGQHEFDEKLIHQGAFGN